MPLGLGASLSKASIVTPGVVTDNLVMKHMYPAGAVQPLSDGAAYFDGTDDRIYLGSQTNVAGGALTMSAWVYLIQDQQAPVLSFGDALLRFQDADDLRAWADVSENSVSTGNAGMASALNRWTHVAFTHDLGTGKIYVDGVEEASGTQEVLSADSRPSYIGNYSGGYFEGYISNVGYWTRALSQAEIKSIMFKQYADLSTSEKTNLVSFWNLDNNLTTQGSSSWVADEADTTFGSNITPTWTSSNGAVIDGQTITLGLADTVSASATISPVGVYKINVTVTGFTTTNSGTIEMPWDGDSNSNMRVSADGTYEFYEASADTSWAVYAAEGVGGTITINSITKANGNIGELK